MYVSILAEYFRYRFVRSIIILACWSPLEQTKLIRQITEHGYSATFSCDLTALNNVHVHGLQGVVYFKQSDDTLLDKMKMKHTSNHFIWIVIGNEIPDIINKFRYDADVMLLREMVNNSNVFNIEDIHIHPREGATSHPWGYWTNSTGLRITHDRARLIRRTDLKGYPLRIAAPTGQYSEFWYNGTYVQYVEDETLSELDSGIRCGYGASKLVIDALNATDEIIQVELWGSTVHNSSLTLTLGYGSADLGGGILRILMNRINSMDYIMPIWPFSVGFTYLAERESSSNMFVEPFTAAVWWSCLFIGIILAIVLRITAMSREEKDGTYIAVLATWLQQDAGAVPNGISGRWTFVVLSLCAMLVHAYYTSAIVSALMSSGRSGPDSLRSLADSSYSIASEDYDYMRYMMFSVKTNWEDLEYLKKKKLTSQFYQKLERGVELIQEGSTAFHSEYNQIYAHFKNFTDDQICKIQHVDTIPESLTWITTTKNGQWTNIFRSTGARILEVGLAKRLVSRLQSLRPECRSSMLAERVKFQDVASLLGLTVSGAFLSLIVLGIEILYFRLKENIKKQSSSISTVEEIFDYVE